MWVLIRLAIGCIFLLSSFSTLLSPYQNFLYVVQAYQMLPSWAELLVAHTMPWFELLVGFLVFFGLWTSLGLRLAAVLFGTFIVVVGQALLRGLPLESCGCFGEWIHLKPQMVLILDSASLLTVLLLLGRLQGVKNLSLDAWFDKNERRS
ncbi:MAG: hypothetical protein HQL13_02285 [Candidatus Omnitrophica bacterium]|nr:hypothetical protein [Candidatus Omnitrophota bacterium]